MDSNQMRAFDDGYEDGHVTADIKTMTMILSRRYECVLTQLEIDLPGVGLEHCNKLIDTLQERMGWYIPVMVSGYHEPGKRLDIEVDGNHDDPDQVLALIREIHEELLKERN